MGVNLSSLISKEKTIEVSYPDIPEWKLEIAYVPREELLKIRNQATKIQWDKAKRERQETIDDEKFLKLYAATVIRGWYGLRVKDLERLLPVDNTGLNPDDEVDYDPDNAYTLLHNSPDFDRFISDVLADVSLFNEKAKKNALKN